MVAVEGVHPLVSPAPPPSLCRSPRGADNACADIRKKNRGLPDMRKQNRIVVIIVTNRQRDWFGSRGEKIPPPRYHQHRNRADATHLEREAALHRLRRVHFVGTGRDTGGAVVTAADGGHGPSQDAASFHAARTRYSATGRGGA